MVKKKKARMNLNNTINKAIATTVVVTAIGITSTINSLPVRAVGISAINSSPETYAVSSQNRNSEKREQKDEIQELITYLLKQGNYKEAAQIRKSFFKYVNPLAKELRLLGSYAVHDIK